MYEYTENGFTTITREMVRTYIGRARNMIVYAKPAFYKEEMEALLDAAERGISCDVYFDRGDRSIRRGFGETEALQLISDSGNLPVTFRYHLKDRIRLAFLIVDSLVILFAPNIRAFEDEKDKLDFPNGVVCKGELARDVIRLFIPELKGADESVTTMVINLGDGAEEETEQVQTTITVNKPEDPEKKQQDLEEAVALLELNPPIKAEELQKTLIYSDNYRVMKVITKGTRITNKKVPLKPFYNMIGVTPENARYDWLVMTREEREKLENTTALYKEISRIKKAYKEKKLLFDALEFGTIIDVTAVAAFQKDLEKARDDFRAHFSEENEDVKNLQQVLKDSEDKLLNELYQHCNNHFDKFKAVLEKDHQLASCLKKEGRMEIFTEFMKQTDYLHKTLGFPTWEKIMDNISMKFNFYDISNEMLNDKDFVAIIKRYGLTPRNYSTGYKSVDKS